MDLNEHFGRNRLFMEYNEECFLEHTHPQIEVFFLMNAFLKIICFRDQSIFQNVTQQMFVLLQPQIHKTLVENC